MSEIMRRIPMKRTGEPTEILGLALYFTAPASQMSPGNCSLRMGVGPHADGLRCGRATRQRCCCAHRSQVSKLRSPNGEILE